MAILHLGKNHIYKYNKKVLSNNKKELWVRAEEYSKSQGTALASKCESDKLKGTKTGNYEETMTRDKMNAGGAISGPYLGTQCL